MNAETETVERTDVEKFIPQAKGLKERADELQVNDQAGFDAAGEMLLGVKELRKQAEEHHRPMIDAAHKSWKAALEGLKRIDEPLIEAERILKFRIGVFTAAQERARIAEERRLREEAERLEAEALEASIEAAEAEGATVEEVQAIIEQPRVAPSIAVKPAYVPVAGISTAKTYRAEVVDLKKLVKAVANGEASESFITANLTALNGVARSTRGTITIPGVRIVEDSTVRAGRR